MATHFSILAWEIPWTEKPTVHGSQTVEHDLATKQQGQQGRTTMEAPFCLLPGL